MQTARRSLMLIPVLALALALVWLRPLDSLAERHVEAGFQRALATFAAARALNAMLSAVQSASVTVGVGVGASVHPGAVLEPIDDLVEQFSSLMLAATISFASQRLLIEIFSAWPVCALVTGTLVAWLVLGVRGRSPPAWLPKLALALLCARLVVPVLALGSEATYQLLLAREYEESQAQVKGAELPEAAPEPGETFGSKFKRWWSENSDLAAKIDALKSNADQLVAHMVKLAAVFIVQTLVLPLVFLWLLLLLYRTLSGLARPHAVESGPWPQRPRAEN